MRFPVDSLIIQSICRIVGKSGLGVREYIGQVDLVGSLCCGAILCKRIYARCKVKVLGAVILRPERQGIAQLCTGIGNSAAADISVMGRFSVVASEECIRSGCISASARPIC